MKIMKLVVAGAALLGSTAAFAGATGNAGVYTSYLFRGIPQNGNGAAVQGGVDYSTSSGLYVGTWVSDTAGGNSTEGYETDVYGGWTGGGFDVGYIFYGYRGLSINNMSEVYAGWSGGGFSGKVYYSPEFSFTEDEGIYATASFAIPLSGSLSLTPQVGYSTGDGVEGVLATFPGYTDEDSYLDYSLTLSKTLDNGFVFSFGAVGNSEDALLGKEKLVVGLKKSFDL